MFRTRLAGVALLSTCFLPGCGLFWGDRPGLCCRRDPAPFVPVSYPGGDAGCGATVIPPSGNPYGAPIYGVPGAVMPGATMPGETSPPPRIPRVGIDEGKGKQFPLDETGRTGPVLTIPANGIRN
jgi:hypothetical protein